MLSTAIIPSNGSKNGWRSRTIKQKLPRPAEPESVANPHTASDLVELIALEPTIRLDIRYATAQNFTGRILYDQPRAFLVRVAAEALVRAHRQLKKEGYGLTIFDGYRPLSVTKKLWDATPPGPKRNYVANPKMGSRHNRGCAVDLSLHDLASGKLVAMPSGYDEFTRRAHRDFMDAPADAIANRQRLAHYLEAEGFRGMSNEWWHFDFVGWEKFPILDTPFAEIG
jgi:zinc D-Ala-D-Ala dipeptidase